MNKKIVVAAVLLVSVALAAPAVAPTDDQRLLAMICVAPEKTNITAIQMSMQLWGSDARVSNTTVDLERLRNKGFLRQAAAGSTMAYARMISWTNMASKMPDVPVGAKQDVVYLSQLCVGAWKAPDTKVWCSSKSLPLVDDSFCAAYFYYSCTVGKQQNDCKKLPWPTP